MINMDTLRMTTTTMMTIMMMMMMMMMMVVMTNINTKGPPVCGIFVICANLFIVVCAQRAKPKGYIQINKTSLAIPNPDNVGAVPQAVRITCRGPGQFAYCGLTLSRDTQYGGNRGQFVVLAEITTLQVWRFEDTAKLPDTEIKGNQSRRSFDYIMKRVTCLDAGIYKCTFCVKPGRVTVALKTLNVTVLPGRITTSVKDKTAMQIEGQPNPKLSCVRSVGNRRSSWRWEYSVDGHPLFWTRVGDDAMPRVTVVTRATDYKFAQCNERQMTEMTANQAGFYRCAMQQHRDRDVGPGFRVISAGPGFIDMKNESLVVLDPYTNTAAPRQAMIITCTGPSTAGTVCGLRLSYLPQFGDKKGKAVLLVKTVFGHKWKFEDQVSRPNTVTLGRQDARSFSYTIKRPTCFDHGTYTCHFCLRSSGLDEHTTAVKKLSISVLPGPISTPIRDTDALWIAAGQPALRLSCSACVGSTHNNERISWVWEFSEQYENASWARVSGTSRAEVIPDINTRYRECTESQRSELSVSRQGSYRCSVLQNQYLAVGPRFRVRMLRPGVIDVNRDILTIPNPDTSRRPSKEALNVSCTAPRGPGDFCGLRLRYVPTFGENTGRPVQLVNTSLGHTWKFEDQASRPNSLIAGRQSQRAFSYIINLVTCSQGGLYTCSFCLRNVTNVTRSTAVKRVNVAVIPAQVGSSMFELFEAPVDELRRGINLSCSSSVGTAYGYDNTTWMWDFSESAENPSWARLPDTSIVHVTDENEQDCTEIQTSVLNVSRVGIYRCRVRQKQYTTVGVVFRVRIGKKKDGGLFSGQVLIYVIGGASLLGVILLTLLIICCCLIRHRRRGPGKNGASAPTPTGAGVVPVAVAQSQDNERKTPDVGAGSGTAPTSSKRNATQRERFLPADEETGELGYAGSESTGTTGTHSGTSESDASLTASTETDEGNIFETVSDDTDL